MGREPSIDRERGVSLSAFTAVVVVALLLVAGLVVDGGQRAAAQRESEAVAAQAARVGVDASSTAVVQGRTGGPAAVAAARASLRSQGRSGTVTLRPGGVIEVRVLHDSPTTFLSLIGIDRLPAGGQAAARLRAAEPA
ncbi:hypothetical protein ACSDQ9_01075 [Aestuariimicrobium soli]|uniref:hypothetical protein n=1 Tax=Aestuariimicrobium soli TaxID=2035834 RepID=UPI003EBA862D